jgi:hypothetical protein
LHYHQSSATFEVCKTSISQAVNKRIDSFTLESKYRVKNELEAFGWCVEIIEGTSERLDVTKPKTKSYKDVLKEVKSVLIENLTVELCTRGEEAKQRIEKLSAKYGMEAIFTALEYVETRQQLTRLERRLVCLRDKTTRPAAAARDKFLASLVEGKHYDRQQITKLYKEAFVKLGGEHSNPEAAWSMVQNYVEVIQKRKKYTVKFLKFSLEKNQNFTVLNRCNSLKNNELKNDFDFMPLTNTPF